MYNVLCLAVCVSRYADYFVCSSVCGGHIVIRAQKFDHICLSVTFVNISLLFFTNSLNPKVVRYFDLSLNHLYQNIIEAI